MNDDEPTREAPVAIDLSRRKRPSGPPAPDPLREAVRESVTGVRLAAAPYTTTTRLVLARLARDRGARAGAVVLAMLALVAVFAEVLAGDLPLACRWRGSVYWMPEVTRPAALAGTDLARMTRERGAGDWLLPPAVAHGPNEGGDAAEAPLAAPSRGHPFGTDAVGRDVFARVVYGARTALASGLWAAALLVALGVALGALAGFAGGIVDAAVARAVEALTAIPTLVLVLVVEAVVPRPTTATLLGAIALTRWTELARLVRAEVLAALESDYVTAARALGASGLRVLVRHVLPNAIAPAIVAATFALAWVVLVEATVDFLRVGAVDPGVSWGEVLAEARDHGHAWWLVVFPGAALLATLLALNLIGEGARNALDPRLRAGD